MEWIMEPGLHEDACARASPGKPNHRQ